MFKNFLAGCLVGLRTISAICLTALGLFLIIMLFVKNFFLGIVVVTLACGFANVINGGSFR